MINWTDAQADPRPSYSNITIMIVIYRKQPSQNLIRGYFWPSSEFAGGSIAAHFYGLFTG